jgi:putative peptidoglycan lipid II flippase
MTIVAKALTATATAISLLTSLATTLYVIWYLGASRETDLVLAAGTVPMVAVQVLLGSVGAVMLPILTVHAHDGRNSLEWALLLIGCACSAFVLLLLWLSAPWWAQYTVPGMPSGQELIELVRWYIIASLPNALAMIALPLAQARGHFFVCEVTGALAALCGLAGTMVLLPITGLAALPIGLVIRYMVQAGALMCLCSRPTTPHIEIATLREVTRRYFPLMWSGALFKTSPLFDRFLCSFLPPGMLTFFHLGMQGFQAVAQIFQRAVVAPFLCELARQHETGDLSGARKIYRSVQARVLVGSASLYITMATLGILLCNAFTVPLIPPALAGPLPWIVLCFLGLYTAGLAGQVAAAWFHACGRTDVPAKVGAIGFVLTTTIKAALLPSMGVFGVALGSSLGQVGNLLAMEWVARSIPKTKQNT